MAWYSVALLARNVKHSGMEASSVEVTTTEVDGVAVLVGQRISCHQCSRGGRCGERHCHYRVPMVEGGLFSKTPPSAIEVRRSGDSGAN